MADLKGDLTGAITAATITMPQCIGYGIIVFAPLGVDFASSGALLGLYTAIFAGFLAAWLGGSPIQITGPKAPSTLVLAALVAVLAANPHIPEAMAPRVAVLVGLVSVTILIGGIFQLCLGSLGFGNLIKYVPYPVVAGFTNGIAFILVQKQLGPLLGVGGESGFIAVLTQIANIEPLTLVVGLSTLVAIFLAPRWIKVIPGSISGLLVGTAVYYSIGAISGYSSLGPLIGKISTKFPEPKVYLDLLRTWNLQQVWTFLPYLFIPGLVLGLLGSLESLLTCVAADHASGNRHQSNRELVGQGIGNIVSSFFGAIFAAGSVPRTLANFKAGGRTSRSGMMCSVIILLVVVVLGPLVGKIPLAVIAGIIIAVAITMVDKGTINIVKSLAAWIREHHKIPFRQESDILFDLFISTTVAVITITFNLIDAVGIGVVIASLLFIAKMRKSIIRRAYYGDQVHARKRRPETHSAMLEQDGRSIVVFELQGPLFFGSAESLAKELEGAWATADYTILDMKRVNEVDSTGAGIILHLIKSATVRGKHLLISYLKGNPALWKFIEIMDVQKMLPQGRFFPNTDAALEWAEEDLLAQLCPLECITEEIPLERMEITQGFTARDLESLQSRLISRSYPQGERIVHQGDASRDLFLLTKGSVTVRMHLPQADRFRRIITYGAGVIFGEMALLDAKARSADVWAEEDSEVLILPYSAFVALLREEPEVALKLMLNISKVLSINVRLSSKELRTLADS
ncbi:MAG: SulP family inorganic anion transporter [Syntrophobacterales bacterium]